MNDWHTCERCLVTLSVAKGLVVDSYSVGFARRVGFPQIFADGTADFRRGVGFGFSECLVVDSR